MATGIPRELAQVPFGVVRPRDAAQRYDNPRSQFARLVERGRLHRLATGYYAVVPQSEDADWVPTVEAAGYGIGASDYGPERVVLMGLSAARIHGALPRAIGICVLAVPKQRPLLRLLDRPADVRFVRRRTESLDAERTRTDLGTALVTGLEQTVLDLAHRPALGGMPDEAAAAVRSLLARCDDDVLSELALRGRLLASLHRARSWSR